MPTRAAFFMTACCDAWGKQSHHEQVIKVLWQKAASPPSMCGNLANTTESSMCGQFSRIHQVAPMGTPTYYTQVASALYWCWPCWVTSRILTVGYVWTCLGLAPWRPFMCGYLHPYLIHGSLAPPESISRTTQHSFQPLLQGSRLWQTDRQTGTLLHL